MDTGSNASDELCDALAILKESARGQWDIDADDLLLKTMMMMQAKFMARFGSVRDKVDELYENTQTASVQLQNAMNSFLLLSQKQFVQNRVSVEDTESGTVSCQSEDDEKNVSFVNGNPTEDMEARVTRVCQEAIDIGVRVLEERIIPLFTEDTAPSEVSNREDSAPDEGDIPSQSFANQYTDRHLMALIGSEQFLTDPYAGYFGTGGADSRRSSTSASSPDGIAEDVGVDVRRDSTFHTDAAVPADTTTGPTMLPAKLSPPAPPPPGGATTTTTTTAGLPPARKPHDTAIVAVPKKTRVSTFLDSSDSSDDIKPLQKPVVGSRPIPHAKKTSHFFKASVSSESTSSDSSDKPAQRVQVKPVPPRKTKLFVSELSSGSEDTKVPPLSSVKKAAKVPPKGIFVNDDSSSEDQSLRASSRPRVVNNKVTPTAKPDVAIEKKGTHKTLDEHSYPKKSLDNDTALVSKVVDLQTVPSSDKVPCDDSPEKQNEVVSVSTANHGSTERIVVSSPVPSPSVVVEQTVPGVVPPPVKVSVPLPERGGKALSTSSSDTEEAVKGRRVPSQPPRTLTKKVPPPPTGKVTARTAPLLCSSSSSSSSSDLEDKKTLHGAAARAPRKVIPKVTFSKRRIYSSGSET